MLLVMCAVFPSVAHRGFFASYNGFVGVVNGIGDIARPLFDAYLGDGEYTITFGGNSDDTAFIDSNGELRYSWGAYSLNYTPLGEHNIIVSFEFTRDDGSTPTSFMTDIMVRGYRIEFDGFLNQKFTIYDVNGTPLLAYNGIYTRSSK